MRFQNSFVVLCLSGGVLFFSSFYFSTISHQPVAGKQQQGFDLTRPVSVQTLPLELLEISGLTDISENKIACVQDEKGIIYTYNITTQKIETQIAFAPDSDYEGLTRVGDVLYTLSSDGTLFETKMVRKKPQTKTYALHLPSADNEGLCYDEKNHRLLIAPKSKLGKGPEFKDTRAIFIFDLRKKELEREPLFYFSVEEIYALAASKNLEPDPVLKKNGEPKIQQNFRPSSLAVHPQTGAIYIISAEDFGLAIFSETGELKNYFALDKTRFTKSEGITFLPNGQLVITNEGVDGNATLLVFEEG
ncbi:MAG: hypothetical protein HYZ14_19230 [Bacteroidetes bacterium]|nr:hypothetical protein [Bacteroidota bacterium]